MNKIKYTYTWKNVPLTATVADWRRPTESPWLLRLCFDKMESAADFQAEKKRSKCLKKSCDDLVQHIN